MTRRHREISLSSQWMLRNGCMVPRQDHVVRVTKVASRFTPFERNVIIHCYPPFPAPSEPKFKTISVPFSRVHAHAGPLYVLLRRFFPCELPTVRINAHLNTFLPLVDVLYAGSVDVRCFPLSLSIRVARLANDLGMKELTQAILITKHPVEMSPNTLMQYVPLVRIALRIGNAKFVDWYFREALLHLPDVSIAQSARIFHLALKARPSRTLCVLKVRLFSHLSKLVRDPCHMRHAQLILPILIDQLKHKYSDDVDITDGDSGEEEEEDFDDRHDHDSSGEEGDEERKQGTKSVPSSVTSSALSYQGSCIVDLISYVAQCIVREYQGFRYLLEVQEQTKRSFDRFYKDEFKVLAIKDNKDPCSTRAVILPREVNWGELYKEVQSGRVDELDVHEIADRNCDPSVPASLGELWKMVSLIGLSGQVVNYFAQYKKKLESEAKKFTSKDRSVKLQKRIAHAREVFLLFAEDVLLYAEPWIPSDATASSVVDMLVDAASRKEIARILWAQGHDTNKAGRIDYSSRAMKLVALSVMRKQH